MEAPAWNQDPALSAPARSLPPGYKGIHETLRICNADMDHNANHPLPIAICGVAMRLPGGIRDSSGLWDFLVHGRDARRPVPKDRYNAEGFDSKLGAKGAIEAQYGYFIEENLESLDSSFFSMTADELGKTDPQQRQILEVTRECLENAGEINYRGKNVGCYVGTFAEDWLRMGARDSQHSGRYLVTGHSDLMIANRVSFEYDFCGPSMVIKTGCSASLVALHEACRALQSNDCEAALVAGTNLILGPMTTAEMTQEGILSPQGSCKTFDAAADGFARAEAINAVYVKRLDDAVRDRNPIRAIIRNTATNSDGRSSSIMQPNGQSHEMLMRRVYRDAGLDPKSTAFVECHGTGTATGDPIEANAVGRVFGEKGVLIGSIKPNLGHSEGASGLTSLIKAILALEHRTVPPNIKFDIPNPKILFEANHLTVPNAPMAWPADRELRISINSFGIGGSNAHVIVDSFPNTKSASDDLETPKKDNSMLLLPISANSLQSLKEHVVNTQEYIKRNPNNITDLIYTMNLRREHLPHRAFAIVEKNSTVSMSSYLKIPATTPRVTMVFSGQGAQWPGMGVKLLEKDEQFQRDIIIMDEMLQSMKVPPKWTLEGELRKAPEASQLHQAEIAQPLCTAIQIGLVHAFRRVAVIPTAVIGHSSGEIAAAYACGALSLRAALIAAYYRGLVTKESSAKGGMAAIGLGADEVTPFLREGVVIACENSGTSTTISGDLNSLDEVVAHIKDAHPEILVRKLRVDMAYHSPHMKPLATVYNRFMSQELTDEIQERATSEACFYSSVTTDTASVSELSKPSYWVSNLVSPVLFKSTVNNALLNQGKNIFLEIGPHSTLAGPLRDIFSKNGLACPYIPSMLRNTDCKQALLSAFGQLYQNGASIRLDELVPEGRVLTDLPTYPWDHSTSCWYELQASRDWRFREHGHHSLLGLRVPETIESGPCWRNALLLEDEPWLYDHKIQDMVVFPFAGYCIMAGEAMRQIAGNESGFRLTCAEANIAMRLVEGKTTEIRTSLRPHKIKNASKPEAWDFLISSYSESGWIVNCEGQVQATEMPAPSSLESTELLRDVQSSEWYDALARVGIIYGPLFQCLTSIRSSPKEQIAVGKIKLRESQLLEPYPFHPVALDACLQLSTVALAKGRSLGLGKLTIPTVMQDIHISRSTAEMTVKAWSLDDGRTINIECVSDGVVVLHLSGLEMTQLGDEESTPDDDYYAGAQLEWRPHFDFLDQSMLLRPPPSSRERTLLTEEAVLLCAIDCAERLKDLKTREPHLLKYQNWLQQRIRQAENGAHPVIEEAQHFISLTQSSRKHRIEDTFTKLFSIYPDDPASTAIKRIWELMENIFTGEDLALDVLSQDRILTRIYNNFSFDHSRFVRALSHTNPTLRILEVGAGTGGTTQTILEHLIDARGNPMYKLYTYTDISDGFFPQAQQRFSHAPNMEYKVFDISKDPSEQGFQPDAYDLILAANVVHATPSLSKSLRNLRSLLKEHGSLVLTEITTALSAVSFIFGTLPGWWLGEKDGRLDQPLVSTERWHQELQESGFTGADTVVYDEEWPFRCLSAIVARRKPTAEPQPEKKITILCDRSDSEVVRTLTAAFVKAGYECEACHINDQLHPKRDVLSTLDLETEFFADLPESRLTAFQKLLHNHTSQKVLWLTSSTQMSCQNPRSAQTIGVARTIRAETGIPFQTLEIEPAEPAFADIVLRVFGKIQATEDGTESLNPDREFAVRKGTVFVGRYHPISVQEERDRFAGNEAHEARRLNTDGRQSAKEAPHLEKLSEGHVELVLNIPFARDLDRDGTLTGPATALQNLGLAGKVRRVGTGVEHVSVNDRVMAVWPGGDIGAHVVLPSSLVIRIPESWDFEQAASVPAPFVTAIWALIDVGRLNEGKSVLLQSPTSPIGHATFSVAKAIGAEIHVLAEGETEARYITDTFSIPHERVYQAIGDISVDNLARDVKLHCMDVVVNWSRDDGMMKSACRHVARCGTFVDLCGGEGGVLDTKWLSANRLYCSVDLAQLAQDLPAEVYRILGIIREWQQLGKLHPIKHGAPLHGEAKVDREEARSLKMNGHVKTHSITAGDDISESEVTTPKHRTLSLDAEAAYLLTGGFGGLGMALVYWLVEHGARTLVILSRSANQTNESRKFVAEIASLGCTIVPVMGQVNVREDVEMAIAKVGKPIKGVVHMAMVLRDSPITSMSHSDWKAVIDPKVNGAWNLHNALINEPLEFFLLTSSYLTAIEYPGQGNYNAANTFLEAFCQYRHHLGLPASVLNICPIDGLGFFATNAVTKKKMQAQGFHFLGEQAFLDFAELSISNSMPPPRDEEENLPVGDEAWSACWRNPSQTLMGLRSELHLDDPQNRASWRRDRRMGLYHNLKAFSGAVEHSNTSSSAESKLTELLSSASLDPDLLRDTASAELIALTIGQKVMEYRLRPDEEVDPSLSLIQMGMDSLKAVELRRWWKQAFKLDVTVFDIMESRPLQQLGAMTADRIRCMLKGQSNAG